MTNAPLRFAAVSTVLALAACSRADATLYCAADQDFVEPLLKDVKERTTLKVRPVFDVEASKTVGLVRTILEERPKPRCDVFWNNEIVHTLRLQEANAFEAYRSPSAESIPAQYKDPEGYWTAFAARARVLIVNTDLVPEEQRPSSIRDLAEPKWKGKVGMARPLTGTTLTHFATLFEVWGDDQAKEFCEALLRNDVNLASGNAPVARLVADGKLAFGLTDSDDFEVQRRQKKPVVAVYPDQNRGGTLVLPNTVALIARAPRSQAAKKVIDAILDPRVEESLAFSPSANMPVRASVSAPSHVKTLGTFRAMQVDFHAVARGVDRRLETLKAIFLK